MSKGAIVYINRFPKIYRLPTIMALKRVSEREGFSFKLMVDEAADLEILKLCKREINVLKFHTFAIRDAEGFLSRWPNIIISLDAVVKLLRVRPAVIIQEGVGGIGAFSPLFRCLIGSKIVVSYERTVFTESRSSLLKRLYHRLYFGLFVDKVVVNGSQTKHLVRNIIGYRGIIEVGNVLPYLVSERRTSSYLGVALNDEIVAESQARINILSVMQLNDRKGADILIKVIKDMISRCSGFHFTVIGDGKYRADFEDLKGSSYRYIRRVEPELMKFHFSRSDYLLLPTREDNFSLVVLEAMSAGCIPITSPYNGCVPDAVGGRSGYVVDASEESVIAMLDVLKKPDDLEREAAKGVVRELGSHIKVARNLFFRPG